MRDWHPVSKFVVVAGVLGLGAMLVFDEEPRQNVVVAASARESLPDIPAPVADIPDIPSIGPSLSSLPPKETFAAMVDRPLFSPTRRPYAPVVVAVEPEPVASEPGPPEPLDPTIRFVGSVSRSNETLALITREDTDLVEALRPGDEVDGWRVTGITDWSLELEAGGEKFRLEIFN